MESWLELAIASIALVFLFLGGLADASLTRKQRLSIREWLEGGNGQASQENPVEQSASVRQSLATIMMSALIVAIAMAASAGIRELGTLWGLTAAVVFGIIAIAVVARGVPHALSERYSISESTRIEQLSQNLLTVTSPVLKIVEGGSSLFSWFLGRQKTGNMNGHSEVSNQYADRAEYDDDERIQDDEHEMISGILAMDEATAREIMVPRPDVVAVSEDMALIDVVAVVQQAGHSRIPVYRGSIDSIQGIVYAKDLLRFVAEDPSNSTLSRLIRPAVFVPESKRIDDLLTDLRRARVHIAVVVDEYGGTAGIVTIEDILEEIVGEIQDEYDRERPLYQFSESGDIMVDGRFGVDELSELIGVRLPDSESETVGGFVQRQLGRIPEAGETVSAGSIIIEVESVEGRRVRSLRVRTSDDPELIDSATVRVM